MATATEPKKPAHTTGGYKDKPWIPRFWDGMTVSAWLKLLWRNGFRIHPRKWGMAFAISLCSVFNSVLWFCQWLIYGRKIARTEIVDEPIFIIGHWRSGTTLLHELMVQDARHTYPSTYACFAPNHFVLTGRVIPWMLNWIMPMQRPIDNMPAGWDHPQEDEFALANMGLPSPYLTMAFPNAPAHDQAYYTFEGVPEPERNRWKQGLLWFLKCVTLKRPGRIVLKSPPHTGRVKTLLEMFPKARFVHIVRDPVVLFASTVNLWKRLSQDEGLQIAHNREPEERVFSTLLQMYDAFERDRALIPPGQFAEVRYEDLISNPVEQMRRIYSELALTDFDTAARPGIEEYMASQKDYKKNRYEIPEEKREEIRKRWMAFVDRYNYREGAFR